MCENQFAAEGLMVCSWNRGRHRPGAADATISHPPSFESGAWSRNTAKRELSEGIPGALTVLLAAIAVNSPLELAGTLGLMLTGQIVFGLIADLRGWFGVIKCRFTLLDFCSVALILCGSARLIKYR